MTLLSRGQTTLERLDDVVRAVGDGAEVRIDEPMSRHTTLRLGGPADVWARVRTVESLRVLLVRAHAAGLPVTLTGGGSNLLVRDGGIRGLVIHLGGLNAVTRGDPGDEPRRVNAEAGASTGRLLQSAIEWGLGGLEFLAGIPGTLGGGLRMNAGTERGELGDVVVEVRSLRTDGSPIARDHSSCGFRYRGSDLPSDEVIIGATLGLEPRERAAIEEDVRVLRERRREREPSGCPSSGSTFKNPTGDHAGRLIDSAGLKGTRCGGAVVSPVHANWLVVDQDARPPCTAADMLDLIDLVRRRVEEAHGITLELELQIVGDDEPEPG
jgi:UDP-N-acetylmuramate dehydrogenase